jgi:hypothetical protein
MSDSTPPPLPTRRRKVRRLLFWVVLVPILGLLGLGSLGAFIWLTGKSVPIRDVDRAVLVTAEVLAENADWFEPVPGCETLTRTRFLDGTYELEYEYEHEDEESYLYCCCLVTVDKSEAQAEVTYASGSKGTELVWESDDVRLVERDDLLRWPDRSRCALIVDGSDVPWGNFFICRSGRNTFEWVVYGMYFDEAGSLEAVLRPILRRLRGYRGK